MRSSAPDKWYVKINIDSIMKIILFTLVVLLPVLVHPYTKFFISPLLRGENMLSTGNMTELYNHYKFILLIVATVLLLMLFFYKLIFLKYQVIKQRNNLPIALIFISLILSLLFAPYKTVALFGNWARYQGTITFLCYLTILFICSNLSFKLKDIQIFFCCLLPLIVVNAFFAVTSFFSIDVFNWHVLENIFFNGLPHKNYLHGELLRTTLENPDYLSGIGGVLTVLFLTMSVLARGIKNKLLWMVPGLLSFTMVASSKAVSGLFSVIACVPIILLIIILQTGKKYKFITFGMLLVAMSIIFVTFNHYGSSMGAKSLSYLQPTSANSITNIQPKSTTASKADGKGPKDYDLNLPPTKFSFGSGRIFIWQKTLGLIKARPIVGYGMDSLAYFFPQDDIGFKTDDGALNEFEDKPHSIYLDFAFGAGIFSLIGFIWLNFNNVLRFIKLMAKDATRPLIDFEFLSLNMAIIAYLIQGLVNDSILSTDVVFWILLGISTAVMYNLTNVRQTQ